MASNPFKKWTFKNYIFLSGFIMSMTGALVFARRIPDVISFDKKRVLEKRAKTDPKFDELTKKNQLALDRLREKVKRRKEEAGQR